MNPDPLQLDTELDVGWYPLLPKVEGDETCRGCGRRPGDPHILQCPRLKEKPPIEDTISPGLAALLFGLCWGFIAGIGFAVILVPWGLSVARTVWP
jgi:hypothetical protein